MVFKPKKKYEWWDGFSRCVDANTVGAVVEKIEERDGAVTKEAFLEESRPENSVTHPLFEWDDAKAAEAYRLDQSRGIINSLRVVYVTPKKEKMKVSAFVKTTPKGAKTSYESIESALNDDGKREIILNRIRGELDAFIARNRHITELADLLDEAANKVRNQQED